MSENKNSETVQPEGQTEEQAQNLPEGAKDAAEAEAKAKEEQEKHAKDAHGKHAHDHHHGHPHGHHHGHHHVYIEPAGGGGGSYLNPGAIHIKNN